VVSTDPSRLGAPNPRLQRTPLRAPLSRKPLGVTRRSLRFVAVAIALFTASASPEVVFPGHESAPDPTARTVVVYRELKPKDENDPHHELFLRDLRDGSERRLLSFTRHAAALWSPDGAAVAVTDWGGSDFSTITVFVTDRNEPPVNIGAELVRVFGRLPEWEENHHVYLEAISWRDSRTLRFRLRGYGERDRDGFYELFDNPLGGNVRRAGNAHSR
jgi:hypothetical protein